MECTASNEGTEDETFPEALEHLLPSNGIFNSDEILGLTSAMDDSDSDAEIIDEADDDDMPTANIKTIMSSPAMCRRMDSFLSWSTIIALLFLAGKMSVSEQQYTVVSLLVSELRPDDTIPCPRFMRKTIRRILTVHSHPRRKSMKI